MLDAGNPYVLPSTLAGAAVYLGLTALTGASLPIRLGALLAFVVVVPVVLNRLLGGREPSEGLDEDDEPTGDEGAR